MCVLATVNPHKVELLAKTSAAARREKNPREALHIYSSVVPHACAGWRSLGAVTYTPPLYASVIVLWCGGGAG